MEFRIADTFMASLAKLSGEEQKLVKTTAFDLQLNPAHPGLKFHRLERAKDRNFWSIRVNQDIRIIVHRSEQSLMLCYVDRHDAAYRWGERRKLEVHPRTGAAQIVEIHELVREVVIEKYSGRDEVQPALFVDIPEETLLSYGVPQEWLQQVRMADEDKLLELADHLPAEAAEALLSLAVGEQPQLPPPIIYRSDPFEHPDAKRRFRVVNNIEELQQALEYPWEKWAVFLHPEQRSLVERDYIGPARISGSAGTGKTIVALHRAVHLARNHPDARVMLTTISDPLAYVLKRKLNVLIDNQPRLAERLEVRSLNQLGFRLYESNIGKISIASPVKIREMLNNIILNDPSIAFNLSFLFGEWEEVVDAWQLQTWEAYRDVRRLGRKKQLPENQRAVIWSIYEQLQLRLRGAGLTTYAGMFHRLAELFRGGRPSPYDYVIVDESQDVSVAQLRFIAALGSGADNGLYFTGDLGQRIFQLPFSWRSLGVDIRGRSATLRINYRTSHHIRKQADKLLPMELSDVDGNLEKRKGTISVFNGPSPILHIAESAEAEIKFVGQWLRKLAIDHGIPSQEIGIFVRSEKQTDRARQAAENAGLPYVVLNERLEMKEGFVSISTMHLTKGLEFRAVAVMACDDEVIPSQMRMEKAAEESDLDEVYHTERTLLYVACTRARDHLLVSGVEPGSEFLEDLME